MVDTFGMCSNVTEPAAKPQPSLETESPDSTHGTINPVQATEGTAAKQKP